MNDFKFYDSHTSSEAEWMGKIPQHWTVRRVQDISEIISGHPFDAKLFNAEGAYPLVRIRDLDSTSTATRYDGEFVDSAAIDSNDVLIGMDGDFNVGRWMGDGKALLNQRMCCVRTSDINLTAFLAYALPTPLQVINDTTYSTTVKHLSISDIQKIKLALPPRGEMVSLVEFIDQQATRIDTLIAKKTRFIELLKEKRQAVITKAVTKGLDDSVEMKDSGVEWIGRIPNLWSLIRIKNACLLKTERQNSCADGSVYIGLEDVESGSGMYCPTPTTSRKNEDSTVGVFKKEDVLYSKLRPYLRKAIVVDDEGFCSTEFLVLNTASSEKVLPKWLQYWLLTLEVTQQIEAGCDGAKMPRASWSHISTIPIPVPSKQEQERILHSLTAQIERLDLLKNKTERSIELLKEKRSALITAAVTGKIDVREAA